MPHLQKVHFSAPFLSTMTALDHGHGASAAAAAAAALGQSTATDHRRRQNLLLPHEDARAFLTDQSGSYVAAKLEPAAASAMMIKAESPANAEQGLASHGGAAAATAKRLGLEKNAAMERPGAGSGGGMTMAMAIASLEDGSMGLKLGKRTYYEDAAAGGGDPAPEAALMESSTSSSMSSSNSTAMAAVVKAANPNGKKQKPSSVYAGVVPKCQAEGCSADLSGAKEYHRRHKVCEWHSKASKARVATIDQRFCQQCSRLRKKKQTGFFRVSFLFCYKHFSPCILKL